MLSRHPEKDGKGKWIFQCSIDALAIIFQVSGLFMWPILTDTRGIGWLLPLSAFLISCGWWENFVDSSSPYALIRGLGNMRKGLTRTRYFTYALLSLWKMLVFFGTMLFSVWLLGYRIGNTFSQFSSSFGTHPINITEVGSSL